MKKLIMLILLIPAIAQAEMRDIHVEWEYTTVTDLAGFKLYLDGEALPSCITENPEARTMDCKADIAKEGPLKFTLTAVDKAGQESAPSAVFAYDAKPIAPKIVNLHFKAPVNININVTP